MRLVASGPDLPAELMRSQESGQLVFFCGAGVSCNVGLPMFGGVVDQVYKAVGASVEDNEVESRYHRAKEFDFVLGALEKRLADTNAVRRAIWQILQIKLGTGRWGLHEALVRLSLRSDHRLQLVTTNYDQAFRLIGKQLKISLKEFVAPLVPIPKLSQWNGLVYLHGFLQDTCDDDELKNLIVTSGDFGRAYLTERWAARFISELFRNFDICFVGYSLNDPVLRYAVDALAADRESGENKHTVWAFVGYKDEAEREEQQQLWLGKGVHPILYSAPAHDHHLLYDTFVKWSNLVRDGLFDGEAVVAQLATKVPRLSASDDDISQMLWALAEPEGKAAHRLAQFNPLPPWEWVEVVMNASLCEEALKRLEIAEQRFSDGYVSRIPFYSLFRRPMIGTSWWCSPFQVSVTKDRLLLELEDWLARYLDDPRFFVRALREGLPSGTFREKILHETSAVIGAIKVLAGDEPANDERRKLCFLWLLLLTGQTRCGSGWYWLNHEEKYLNPLQTQVYKTQIATLLKPLVCWQTPLATGEDIVEKLFNEATVELTGGFVDKTELRFSGLNAEDLCGLLRELEGLLSDALGLVKTLGKNDRGGVLYLGSVEPHTQNKTGRSWEQLIEIIRDVWLQLLQKNANLATSVAQRWFEEQAVIFKRLALFTASKQGVVESRDWLDWLLRNNQECLWHPYCKREVCRLLANRGGDLSPESLLELERALLDKSDASAESTVAKENAMRALRLIRLQRSSAQLSHDTKVWMQQHAKLCAGLREEKCEFSVFRTFRWLDVDEEIAEFLPETSDPKELAVWLLNSSQKMDECWEFISRTENKTAFSALIYLADDKDQWPILRWKSAFYAVQKNEARDRWQLVSEYLAELVRKAHDQAFFEAMLSWLADVAEGKDSLSDNDIALLLEVLSASLPTVALDDSSPADQEDCIDWAINQSAQKLTDVLVSLCFKHAEAGENGLPENCVSLLSAVCDTPTMRAGWFWLAVHLVFFAQRDFGWTSQHLLPKFTWKADDVKHETLGMWQGFFSSPRNVPELMSALKTAFMQTAKHYDEFQQEKNSYIFFLTYLAVMGAEGYNPQDFYQLFHQLPKEALPTAIEALTQGISSDLEKAQQFWENRIKVFWHDVFPKDKACISDELTEALALLAIASKKKFPDACRLFEGWFRPLVDSGNVEAQLSESTLGQDYPTEVKDFRKRLGLVPERRLGNKDNLIEG